jgi:hypothetical protein
MNLFRSKEHARSWSKFEAGSEDGIISLLNGAAIISSALAKNDLDADEDTVHLFRRRGIVVTENSVSSNLLYSLDVHTRALIRQFCEIFAAMRVGDAEQAKRLKREYIRRAREWIRGYRKYLL